MDVKGLYPNVPRKEAKVAVREALNNRSDQTIPTEEIIKMMDVVLENNNFSFNNKHFIQTEGTAIGSRLGMNYASTYLGKWEQQLFEQADIQPLSYFRYVDDIWGLWTGSEKELQNFHQTANSIHPNIQVDLRYGTENIEFLDVKVSIVNNKIETDLFSKPSDKHLFLHQTSCHPDSVKKGIPYGLGVRLKRICSDKSKYEHRRNELCEQLSDRGYDQNQVEEQLEKVDKNNRTNLLQYRKKKNSSDRVPLVLTFNAGLPNIHTILKKHQKTLYKSQRMKTVFKKTPIVSFKRDTNLQDILIHKKHNRLFFGQTNKCEPCGKDCAICPYVLDTSEIKNNEGEKFKIRNHINCKSVNVVYALFCVKCNKYIYVGETGDTLYQRHILNFSLIRRHQDDPVAKHFYTDDHTKEDFRIVGIEKLYGSDEYRKTRELLWMKKMKTFKPHGINTKEQ